MTWTTPAFHLKRLDTMTILRLLLIWKTLGHQLKALDAMNSLGLRIEMNNSG